MKKESVVFLFVFLLVNIGIVSAYASTCESNLIAYYNGDSKADLSGNNNAAYLFGGVNSVSGGKIGNAFNFNGKSSEFIELPKKMFESEKFSFALWIKTSRAKGGILYVSKDNRYVWEFNPLAGFNYMNIQERGLTSNLGTTSDGKWHYLVFTFDSVEGKSKVYQDGELKSEIIILKSKLSPSYAALGQYQGTEPISFDPRFSFLGLMDEVAVFNRVLTSDEVKAYYNNGTGKEMCTNSSVVCTESWNCGVWSNCINGEQTRTCTDANSCGTTTNKPITSQTCTQETCTESWNCGVWSNCINGEQTRTCTDANSCGTTTNKPAISQNCITENNQSVTNITETNGTMSENLNCTTDSECALALCVGDGSYCPEYNCIDNQCVARKDECTSAGYKCTSGIRGCGQYDKIDLTCASSAAVCCEEIPYCGDGVCFEHNISIYGENKTNCPQDCAADSCNSLIEKIAKHEDYTYNGVEFKSSWNDSYETTEWFGGKEYHGTTYYASWNAYDNDYKYINFNAIVFDDEDIDLNEWLNQRLDYQVCQVTNHWVNGKDNTYYICNWDILTNQQDNGNYQYSSREVFWTSGNVAISVYVTSGKSLSDEEVMELSQKKISSLLDDLKDNRAKYVSWDNFDFDWILRGQITDLFGKDCKSDVPKPVNSQTNETCWPSWQCKIEPAICPEYGYQTRTCMDYSCGKEVKKDQIYCTPGICSGCLVPRWFDTKGLSDNTCIPYGFRFSQQTGWEKKLVEQREEDILKEGDQEDVSLDVLSDTEAILTLRDRDGKEYNYTLTEGESTKINIPNWESDIDTIVFNTKKIVEPTQDGEEGYVEFSATVYGWENSPQTINAYCDIDGEVKQQKIRESDGNWAKCQNNYECYSNFCSAGECIEVNDMLSEASGIKSLGIKVLCRIASIFGIENYDSCVVNYLGGEYSNSVSSGSGGGSSSSKN